MKKVYIVLTHTGTILSRVIKIYTKDEFSHVSISLDEELEEMYSFGRLNPNNPFIGGFVHESIHNGTFKRFFNTKAKIFLLNITEEQYEKVKYNIRKIEENKEKYTFNILGLFAAGFNKKIQKEHSFYCAEFVRALLQEAYINLDLPEIIKPEDFKNIPELEEIYSGLLRKYQHKKINVLELMKESMHTVAKKEV